MGFRYSAVLSTSLILIAGVSARLAAQAFGRFGYSDSPTAIGFKYSRSGIVADAPSADVLKFYGPSKLWRPVETTDRRQIILLSGGYRKPAKLRLDLSAVGPELYFENGFELDVESLGSPYLSWADGSAGEGVPTPASQAVLLSFRTDQPPILLVALGKPAAFAIHGKPGAWRIQSEGDFSGWVRLVLPCGLEPIATPSAARLGRLYARVDRYRDDWLRETPAFAGLTVDGDLESVTATWKYSGRGAIVPPALALAAEAGYPVQIKPKLRILDGATREGPRFVLDERELTVRFPVRRIPNGRAVCLGPIDLEPPATISPIDLGSVVELALANLCGARPDSTRKLGEDTLAQYLAEADYVREPFTGQQLPFTADGSGADLAAGHAILMQALSLSTRTNSDANSLLTSLSWRRDAYTLLIDGSNAVRSRRASALAAVAGALCPEPARRLEAALLQAGLSVGALLDSRAGRPAPIEPLLGLRTSTFALRTASQNTFADGLRSPLRVFGPDGLTAEKDARGVVLTWTSSDGRPSILTLASAYSAIVENVNLKVLEPSSAMGILSIKYEPRSAGECRLRLVFPPGTPALPKAANPQPFSDGR